MGAAVKFGKKFAHIIWSKSGVTIVRYVLCNVVENEEIVDSCKLWSICYMKISMKIEHFWAVTKFGQLL